MLSIKMKLPFVIDLYPCIQYIYRFYDKLYHISGVLYFLSQGGGNMVEFFRFYM